MIAESENSEVDCLRLSETPFASPKQDWNLCLIRSSSPFLSDYCLASTIKQSTSDLVAIVSWVL